MSISLAFQLSQIIALTVLSAGRPLELTDYYRLETAGSPAISPDGRRVAFVRTWINESENRRQSEIWVAPTDGSAPPLRITNPAFSASNPRWSADGSLLAFTSRRKGTAPGSSDSEEPGAPWFLRMEAPGGEAFQIPGVGGVPIFSPDNRWIAFTQKLPAKKAKQYDSETERLISERFKGHIYDWMNARSDGKGYLPDPRDPDATPAEELFIVPREGGTPKQLTSLGVTIRSVAWRPDGGALAFIANTHQRDEYLYDRADLWTITTAGQTKRLTDDGYEHETPAWSPDGRWLVFRRSLGLSKVIESKQSHGAPLDLFRMPAGGGAMINLTESWDLRPGDPFFSTDGRYVYFVGGIGGNAHLFRTPSSGGPVQQVTQGDRHLGGFSASKSGDWIAYTSTDPLHPAEVFVSRLDGSKEKRISSLNEGWLKEIQLSSPKRELYSSKDGTRIEGWVLLPHGAEATKGRCPLILAIHGGPHGAYGNTFSFEFQLLAARGHAVFYANPRGSTGYGEKFLWATWGGWGRLDYEDLMSGVDHVLERYPLDAKQMGVTGYSYGGFLTNWIITQTDRFAAAITGAGISNWISDYGTADIPNTKESEFFGPPWEPRSGELLAKLSPITHVKNVKTPTLFIHGESDLRVPIEQAEQMYTALKKRKVPAKLVRYADSYHGNWTPWNTVHRYHQELKWWGQYLKPKNSGPQVEASSASN
jgi:dipeptidyl aminopeptidase/acylaminoacyl peptidase